MRHEQACAYAADAYARTTGTPGVCCVTAGCGLTNAVTGLCVAGLTGSAVVCIAGQHPTTEDGLGSFQEAYGAEICRTFSKYVKRVLDWSTIEVDLRQAFREARSPPQGVGAGRDPDQHPLPPGRPAAAAPRRDGLRPDDAARAGRPGGDRARRRAAARAERPLIVAGDGVFWSDAAAELRELRRAAAASPSTRAAPAQGAVPEDHPLAVRGAWKKPFTGRADVVLAVGFKFWSGEHFGEPPTWNDTAHLHPGRRDARRASAGTCRPRWRSSAIRSSCCAS